MDQSKKNNPLSAQELDQLERFFSQVRKPSTLSLEGMDGLFCALIAGPAWVVPGEYLPLLWGGPLADEIVAFNVVHVNEMIDLLIRHWNSILSELDRDAVHSPLIDCGNGNATPGRAWAQGFMRGVNFVQSGWRELLQDDTSSELYRIFRLARGPDSPVRHDMDSQKTSREILPWIATAVAKAYQQFRDPRDADRLKAELIAELASR